MVLSLRDEFDLIPYKVMFSLDMLRPAPPYQDRDVVFAAQERDRARQRLESLEYLQKLYLDGFGKSAPDNVHELIDDTYALWRRWEKRYSLYFGKAMRRYVSILGYNPLLINTVA